MLLEETKLSPDEFDEILDFLKEEIVIVPAKDFIEFLPEAEKVSPDPKDKQYFALAIVFNCGIFSGDLKLKEQSKVKIYSPSELLGILQSGENIDIIDNARRLEKALGQVKADPDWDLPDTDEE